MAVLIVLSRSRLCWHGEALLVRQKALRWVLVRRYAALPELIPEMKLFEYGKLDPEAREGYGEPC